MALLGISVAALFVVYLLRVLWGRKPVAPKASKGKRVIVDGSNVMFWGGEPSLRVLTAVIGSLRAKGYAPYVIFDANIGYKLGDRYLDDAPMAKLIGLPARQVLVVEKGVAADEWILQVAQEQGVRVVSNDRFRDWKVQYPLVGKKGRIIRGTYAGGNVVWKTI